VALDTLKTIVVESKETPRVERAIETAVVTEEKRVLTSSLEEMVDFMTGELLENEEYAEWVNEEMRGKLTDVSRMMDEGIGKMKGKEWSMAAIVTSYADEGDETHDFLKRLRQCCEEELEGEYALIGESVMFDEMREGFGKELLLLTILTVLAIFLIVALTFRSVLLPVLLVDFLPPRERLLVA
jgi:predicted RND superfamily exporter protein